MIMMKKKSSIKPELRMTTMLVELLQITLTHINNVFTRRETNRHVVFSSFSSWFLIEYLFTFVTEENSMKKNRLHTVVLRRWFNTTLLMGTNHHTLLEMKSFTAFYLSLILLMFATLDRLDK